MELKKSSIEDQKKDSKRDFNNPQLYICEVVDKESNNLIGVLPFMAFSKLDAMVIINSLATQVNIPSKSLNFVALENSNTLVSAVGESEKYKLSVSLEDLEEVLKHEKKGEENDEESGSVQESEE